MKNLRSLGAAVALTFTVAVATFADCEPLVPGQIPTPPCAVAQMTTPNDSSAPGQTEMPLASTAVDALSVAELAINMLLF